MLKIYGPTLSPTRTKYSKFPTRRFQVRSSFTSKAGVALPSIKELSTLIKRTNPIVRFYRPTITCHKSATVSVKQNNRRFFVDDSGGHKLPPISCAQRVDVEACSQCKVDSSTRGPAVGNDAWATKKSNV